MTCVDLVVNGRMCSVHVQRIACSNITGKNSSVYSILPKCELKTEYNDIHGVFCLEVKVRSISSPYCDYHFVDRIKDINIIQNYT